MSWSWTDPGVGSPATLNASLTTLNTLKTDFTDAQTQARNALDGAGEAVWSGSASGAWRSGVSTNAAEVDGIVSSIDDARAAVEAYANELTLIVSETDREQQKLRDAAVVQQSLVGNPRPPWDLEGIADDTVKRITSGQDILEAGGAILALAQRRQSADDALVGALQRAIPESWSDIRAAFAAVGITGLDDLTDEAVADAMLEIAQSMDHGGSEEQRRALLELFEAYGDDPEIMSDFFESLGGTDTAILVSDLGSVHGEGGEADDPALLLAQRIRAGLSAGSADWDEETANQFADDMFYGLPDGLSEDELEAGIDNGRYAAIAYLFSDQVNAPMGEGLSAASADIIDQRYRVEGGYFPMGPLAGAANFLAETERAGSAGYQPPRPWEPVLDIASEVFSTLGTYPDSALAYLEGGDENSDGVGRIEYWYGEHDWSVSDGFEGVSGLLLGATQATGGPYSGEYSQDVDGRIAEIVSEAFFEITGNEEFVSEHLSSAGAAQLAGSLAPYLDGLAEYLQSTDGTAQTSGFGMETAFGTDEERAVPWLSKEAFAELLGVITAEESAAGAQVLQSTVDAYQSIYLEGGAADPDLLSTALDRLGFLQGTMDGANITQRLEAAGRHDAAVDSQIDLVVEAIGLLPIPYLNEGIDSGRWIIDTAFDQGRDAFKDWGVELWKGAEYELPDVTSDMEGFEEIARASYIQDISGFLSEVLPDEQAAMITGMPERADGQSDAEYASAVEAWWYPISEDLQESVQLPGINIDHLVGDYGQARDAAQHNAQNAEE